MTAGIDNKLPYGNLPRLLLAWVCTEAVRTQSRELVLGSSLSDFMGKLGMAPVGGGPTGARTRLRNQMRRLFQCHIQLIHDHKHGEQFVSSAIAGLSNRFSVIFFRACRGELLHLCFPAGQVQVLPAG